MSERHGNGPARPSFAQERLWFLDQLQPGDPAYNLHVALRLEGDLDAAALERALEVVVARHEALRTTFPTLDGQPVLSVSARVAPDWSRVDLRAIAATEREARHRALVREETGRPFDVA